MPPSCDLMSVNAHAQHMNAVMQMITRAPLTSYLVNSDVVNVEEEGLKAGGGRTVVNVVEWEMLRSGKGVSNVKECDRSIRG